MIRAQRGDEDAFTTLAYRVGGRLLEIAQRILRDVDLAEDATQQAIIGIWQQLPQLRDPAKFDGWAYRILVNACRTQLRRERRWTPGMRLVPVEPIGTDPSLSVADRDQLERAFRRLPIEHRSILVMQHYLGLTLEEIADQLGLPLGTARSRSHYAKRNLRAAIEADARPGRDRQGTA